MKRIAFCFDGTRDRLGNTWPYSTNVVLTAQSILPIAEDKNVQIVHYDQGVGTAFGTKLLGSACGLGVLSTIEIAYTFLVFNYEVGDEIFVFGFSRGALTARAFVGMLRTVGILRRCDAGKINLAIEQYKRRKPNEDHDSEELMKFRLDNSPQVCVDAKEDAWRSRQNRGYVPGTCPLLRIRYLGLWDTVESIGIPQSLIPPWFGLRRAISIGGFFDADLSDMVVSARHALSIDENRVVFAPTLWTNTDELNASLNYAATSKNAPYQQKWFPGGHGSVGGGGPIRGLSDNALDWVVTGAREAKLSIDLNANSTIFTLQPDPRAPLDNMAGYKLGPIDILTNGFLNLIRWHRAGPYRASDVSPSAITRWRETADNLPEKKTYRPKTLKKVSPEMDAIVRASQNDEPPYDPDALPTPPAAQPIPGAYYRVVLGDDLTSIALRAYGNPSKYTTILQRNWQLLNDDKDRIYVGQPLYIPKLDE